MCLDYRMAIRYPVGVGTILRCDYSLGGFRAPEMVKARPAVVISPRLPYRDGPCAIVPLSGSHDGKELPYIVRIELSEPLPSPYSHPVMWAKCDMVSTVSFERLDLFHSKRDQTGKRTYLHPKLSREDLDRIIAGVRCGLGIS